MGLDHDAEVREEHILFRRQILQHVLEKKKEQDITTKDKFGSIFQHLLHRRSGLFALAQDLIKNDARCHRDIQ